MHAQVYGSVHGLMQGFQVRMQGSVRLAGFRLPACAHVYARGFLRKPYMPMHSNLTALHFWIHGLCTRCTSGFTGCSGSGSRMETAVYGGYTG